MINRLKRGVSILMMAATLSMTTMTASAPKAEAGILFLPFIFGIFFLLTADQCDEPGLCILLGTNGGVERDALAAKLSQQYPELDTFAAMDLADGVRAKAAKTTADDKGQKFVTLTQAELSDTLKASNIEQTNPELFGQIVADLK